MYTVKIIETVIVRVRVSCSNHDQYVRSELIDPVKTQECTGEFDFEDLADAKEFARRSCRRAVRMEIIDPCGRSIWDNNDKINVAKQKLAALKPIAA